MLEIEVVTTKKKLTQSLVKQMPQVTFAAMMSGTTLGWVQLTKESVLVIAFDGEHYQVARNWTRSNDDGKLYRKVGRWSQSWDFKKQDRRDQWFEKYQERLEEAVHVYL